MGKSHKKSCTVYPRSEANGADRSLRAWLRAVSSGLADIDPLVLPPQTIDKQDVDPWDLDGRPWENGTLGEWLRNQGVQAAQLVMLGGVGAGTSSGFWSRVVMLESNGWWLMELIHSLTRFVDLYAFRDDIQPPEPNIGRFDEMSGQSQTHPSIFTKNELGWVGASTIPLFPIHAGASANYALQYASLTQPPLAGRVAAVRIGAGFPYVIVEARKKTDQFETGMPLSYEMGIPTEGVIAYRVQIRDATNGRVDHKIPLYLMTQIGLNPGQSAELDNSIKLTVISANPDGFNIKIKAPPLSQNVIVPSVIGAKARVARLAILNAGLKPIFSGNQTNTVVGEQSPEGGDEAKRGSKVHLTMTEP